MSHPTLRFRQIHLDFHTHQSIADIGADFDADHFADTLARARVDSINLFGRCHHGYIYHQSEVFRDIQHPHLSRDLLREQVAACHARDIRTPIYITVQWDALNAHRHPEWLCRTHEGKVNIPVGRPGFYNHLCVNSPYRHWLKDYTTDVLQTVEGDGLWFDIVMFRDCFCTYCVDQMLQQGIDPMDEDARHHFAFKTILDFQRDMTAHVNSVKPDQLIFYNSGHVGPAHRDGLSAFTHLELESLPGGAWGYDHFPQTARYARTLGVDFLGMTGKFHTAWGDFHSFKSSESLKYECGVMLAMAGKCCIGDQLHPRGEICETTYDLIGGAFQYVEACEQWCADTKPITDIAVLSPEAFIGIPVGLPPGKRVPPASKGVCRVLQELHHQFDMIDADAELDDYRLVILPDEIPLNGELAAKVNRFIEAGGAVIASHRSGLSEDGQFAIPVGAEHDGDESYEPTFVKPSHGFDAGLPDTHHVMYRRGSKLKQLDADAEVLVEQAAPYFNRTWRHFCSHRHAPIGGESLGPAAIQRGKVIYFTHPVFHQFHEHAPPWVRRLLAAAVARLLSEPVVSVENGATTLLVTVADQPHEKRRMVHLLHAIPVSSAQQLKTINEEIPLHGVRISVASEKMPTSVMIQPDGDSLPFEFSDGRVRFTVPRVGLHTMVVIA